MKRLYLIIILLFIHVNNLSQELLYDISRFDYLFAEGENVTYAATVGELLIMQVMKNKCDQYCGDYYQPHYSIGLFDLSNSSVPKEVGRVYKNIFYGETKYAESFIYVDSSALHYPYYKFYFEDSQETPAYIWSPNLVIRKDSLIFEFFHYSDELNVYKINGNGEIEYLNTHILQAKLGWVTGYGVIEDYFYITNRAPSGLVIVDVSNVNQINEITHSISNKDLTGLIIGEDRVIIGEAFDKIHILDVSDPTNPHSISSPFFQHGLLTGAYKEEFFYLSGGRNFSSLNEISLDMKTIKAQGYISEITMGENSIILSTNMGFEIFDDSEPENPQKLSNCGANIAKPIQFIKRDSLIYVCNGGDGLSILNAADSSNIKLISSLDYEGFAVDLVLDSTFIYIANYLKGLIIINVNNPSSPFIESEFFIHNGPASLTKLNNYVFIICDDNKLYALDISNISIPQIVYEKQFPSNGGMHWGDYKKVISANNIIWIKLTSLPLLAFYFSEESGFTEIFKYESYFSFDPREINVIDSLLFYTHINGIQIINLNSNTIINENGFGSDHMEESPIGIAYNYENNILYASMIVFGISGIKAYDLSELKNPIRIPGYFPLGFAPNQILWQNGLLYFLTPSGIGIASEDEVSSVHNIDNDLDPNEFHLSQNYPNPFNPSTVVEFRVSNYGLVCLKVFDVLGREIATLINESKPPGTYEVEFDAKLLPSGVYFYRLTSGNYTETKKMVYLRQGEIYMKVLLLIIIFSITFTLRSQTSDNSYFPLAVGNEWNYTSNLFPSSESIIDTVRVDGVFYYVASTYSIDPLLYYRESSNKVFVRKPGDSLEVMLYNFDAEIEESWELSDNFACSFGVEVTLVSKDDTIDVPIGTFYNCYHFRHMAPCNDAGIMDTWLAKGIGKAKYSEEFFIGIGNFELTYFIITKIKESSSVPVDFHLSQNYPNPFNPTTTIKFALPFPSQGEGSGVRSVKLVIYDILGCEVQTLINETKAPGKYEVEFDGSQLPSGVYFYRLQAGGFTQSKKMLLLK